MQNSSSEKNAQTLQSRFLGELRLEFAASYILGRTPLGERRFDRFDSGHLRGPRIDALVLPGTSDCLLGGGDGAFRPDVRVMLRCDDGDHVLLTYQGVRHGPPEVMARFARQEPVEPGSYYLRALMRFETASPRYDWLNRIVAVGIGRREPRATSYDIFEVL